MFNQKLFTKYFKNANQGGLGEISKALLKERGKVQALERVWRIAQLKVDNVLWKWISVIDQNENDNSKSLERRVLGNGENSFSQCLQISNLKNLQKFKELTLPHNIKTVFRLQKIMEWFKVS